MIQVGCDCLVVREATRLGVGEELGNGVKRAWRVRRLCEVPVGVSGERGRSESNLESEWRILYYQICMWRERTEAKV